MKEIIAYEMLYNKALKHQHVFLFKKNIGMNI